MGPKSSSATQSGKKVNRDWNLVWPSRNLADLAAIPIHKYGMCGCTICGTPRSVKGSTFVAHMREIYTPKSSSNKRARTISNTPGPSNFAHAPEPAAGPSFSASVPQETNVAGDIAGEEYEDIDNYVANDGLDLDIAEATDQEREEAPPQPQQGASSISQVEDDVLSDDTVRLALEAMFAQGHTDESDFAGIRPLTPEPAEYETLPSPASIADAPIAAGDLLNCFQVDIPISMRQPAFSGARPNPHLASSSETATAPLFQRALPLLVHALTGLYGIARRPINLVLQVSNIVIRNAENRLYQRFRQWYVATHPDAPPEVLDDLDRSLNPAFDLPAAPTTLETALRRIGVSHATIVHPVCSNRQCHNVFYSILTREGFKMLPKTCPACQAALYDSQQQPTALHFARRSLKDELEVVLGVRGVEHAVEQRDKRKSKRDEEDGQLQEACGKVYRQQDDGTAWTERNTPPSPLDDALQLTVNLSVDWANASSKRSASTNSIGPIILQLADLPAQLRASFACTMVVGITPGPKAPRAANLYKLLLPLAMELRDSEANGIWLQTPKYPQGRLVRVRLGVLVCDRPAAVEVTGGPSFSAFKTPCLRCTLHASDIMDLSALPHPLRNSDAHNRAIFEQILSLPEALKAHHEAFKLEQQRLVSAGVIPRPQAYTKAMVIQATQANNQVSGHVSALGVINGFDKFGMTPFDPMHSLLEGLVKTYFHRVLITGKHGSAGDQRAEETARGVDDDGRLTDEDERMTDDEDRRVVEDGDSAGETDWGSDTEAATAQAVAARVVGGFETGRVVIPTAAELAVLKKGVKAIGKKGKTRVKKLGDSGVRRLQSLIAEVTSPSSIPNLHPEFGMPSAGTPSASHWRAFAAVYAPLTLPRLFFERGRMTDDATKGNPHLTSPELRAMMLLFEVVALALRTTTSDALLDRLDSLVTTFLALAFSLHPSLQKSTNFHVVTHLAGDVRRFGPATGWWTFPTERVNYVIKNVNMSGANRYQASTLGLRAVVRAKQMVSARLNALQLPEDADQEDRDLVAEMEDTFDAFHQDGAADTLEQIALRFAEIDRLSLSPINALSSRDALVLPRGASQDRTLDDNTLSKLQDCLRKYGEQTRTVLDIEEGDPSLLYLPSRGVFWQGVTFAGRRLDAAEWGKPLQIDIDAPTVSKLVCSRNGLFESRREEPILKGDDRQVVSGVLCAVFEHRASLAGVLQQPRLFGIVRKLRKHEGPDRYGYRQHPSLNVWLWEQDQLDDPVILWLNPNTLNSLRPLAVTVLPIDPCNPSDHKVWATIPVPYY